MIITCPLCQRASPIYPIKESHPRKYNRYLEPTPGRETLPYLVRWRVVRSGFHINIPEQQITSPYHCILAEKTCYFRLEDIFVLRVFTAAAVIQPACISVEQDQHGEVVKWW